VHFLKKLSISKSSLDEILIEVGFIEKSEEVSNLDNVLLKMLLKFGVQTY
jgi:tRNA-binding EMAP/Myf-like protein